MRRTAVALAAALACMALPAAAAASMVSVEGGVLLVAAAPGETNEVSVSQRIPPGSETPSEYAVKDTSAGTTPGAGCGPDPTLPPQGSPVVCPASGVQSVVIRLGDGDDRADYGFAGLPISIHGEAGSDHIAMFATAGTLADGGDGNDVVQGGDDVRGGPGDDQLAGSRLLDGGDGNDILRKVNGNAGGRLVGGPGDDAFDSGDGWADELECGAGRDVITNADDSDRNDGSCESGKGVGGGAGPSIPQVTVFELPKGRSRPGRDGRLAVWMRCTVPRCAVTVRIFSAGDAGIAGFVRFRNPPLRHVVVGTAAKLVRLPLSRSQRRGLSRSRRYSGVGAIVITRRPGADAKMLTDGLYCTRADPCTGGGGR
jgi:hypothetical protein